jgi:predicted ABC-type sugar transport system permease subunit
MAEAAKDFIEKYGWKSIVGTLLGAIVIAVAKAGWIPAETAEWLLIPIGAATAVSFRVGIAKSKPKVEQ